MSNCPYCNVEINEAFNFCIECEKQVKCLSCSVLLLKNKSKCLSCGSLLQVSQSNSIPMNTFSLQEEQSKKGYLRNINLSFTNETASTVASVVGGYVPFSAPTSRLEVATIERQQQPIVPPFQVLEETIENTQQNATLDSEDKTEKEIEHYSDTNNASEYFEQDEEGFLVPQTRDYKGKNKKLQQQRFSLLYVWAYKLILQNSVSIEHLTKAAKRNGIYDKNYTSYLSDIANRFFVKMDDTFKLNPAGEGEVGKVILEIQDSDLEGYEYWNPKKRNSSPRINEENERNIAQWIQKESRFDNNKFDVRTLKTAADLAILAIYDITKELKVKNSVKSSLAVNYLLKRYKTISKKKKVLIDTIAHKKYNNYFVKTDKGEYYLSLEAEKLAESWLGNQ